MIDDDDDVVVVVDVDVDDDVGIVVLCMWYSTETLAQGINVFPQ